jgi:hypothetical protein
MRGLPGTRAEGPRSAAARIALTGVGLSLMLAIAVPLALLSHPARGVVLPGPTGAAGAAGAAGTVATGATGTLAGIMPAVQPQDEQGDVNHAHSNADPRGRELSRAEAVALVQRRYHARVVRTHLLQDANGRPIYEFRLLSAGGKVWTVHIDAYSGAELP